LLRLLKAQIDPDIIIVGDLNTLHNSIDFPDKKINKDALELNNIMAKWT
jgi:exonuclease III